MIGGTAPCVYHFVGSAGNSEIAQIEHNRALDHTIVIGLIDAVTGDDPLRTARQGLANRRMHLVVVGVAPFVLETFRNPRFDIDAFVRVRRGQDIRDMWWRIVC